jgi:hypothetical protein
MNTVASFWVTAFHAAPDRPQPLGDGRRLVDRTRLEPQVLG